MPTLSWLGCVAETIVFSNPHLTSDPLPASLILDQKAALQFARTSHYCHYRQLQLFPFTFKSSVNTHMWML